MTKKEKIAIAKKALIQSRTYEEIKELTGLPLSTISVIAQCFNLGRYADKQAEDTAGVK